jgi:hypothetical protein
MSAVYITSESGLRIIGPVPSPATKSERPSVQTSREDPNAGSSWPYVDVYKDEVHVLRPNNNLSLRKMLLLSPRLCTYTHSELALQINTMTQRLSFDMLRGLSGSESPSQVTRYGCSVTTPGLELFGRALSGSASKHVYPSPPARDWCDRVLRRLRPSCDLLWFLSLLSMSLSFAWA